MNQIEQDARIARYTKKLIEEAFEQGNKDARAFLMKMTEIQANLHQEIYLLSMVNARLSEALRYYADHDKWKSVAGWEYKNHLQIQDHGYLAAERALSSN